MDNTVEPSAIEKAFSVPPSKLSIQRAWADTERTRWVNTEPAPRAHTEEIPIVDVDKYVAIVTGLGRAVDLEKVDNLVGRISLNQPQTEGNIDKSIPDLPVGIVWANDVSGVLFVAKNNNEFRGNRMLFLDVLALKIRQFRDRRWPVFLRSQASKLKALALAYEVIADIVENNQIKP